MTPSSVVQLRSAIEQLDKLEADRQITYLAFVTVLYEHYDEAVALFNALPNKKSVYIIRLPHMPTSEQAGKESIEVAKHFAEALSQMPQVEFELYYMLISRIAFVRQYHTHHCQMIPTSFYRAFEGGVKVYNHLRSEYEQRLELFLNRSWERIFALCRDDRKMDCFTIAMGTKKGEEQPDLTKLMKQLMACLLTDEELKCDDQRRYDVAQLRQELMMHIGAYRIGPIFLSNSRNGDNRNNYAGAGTYFPTESAATNFVLCNTTAMRNFSTVPPDSEPEQGRRERSCKGLAYLSSQMWAAGNPAMVVFNYDYCDKVPFSASSLLRLLDKEVDVMGGAEEVEEETSVDTADDAMDVVQRPAFDAHKEDGLPLVTASSDPPPSSNASLLKALLASAGFILQDVGGAGDCLFRSLAAQMGDVETHGRVRNTVVHYLRTNKPIFLAEVRVLYGVAIGSEEREKELYEDFLEHVGNDGAVEGGIAIHAFALAYHCEVRVYYVNDKNSSLAELGYGVCDPVQDDEVLYKPLYRIAWLRSANNRDGSNHYMSVEEEAAVEARDYLEHCQANKNEGGEKQANE